jgi:aspartyl-tRNA(Asn)/glutamyl-tRNA(Gln) amidotransferase subunit A
VKLAHEVHYASLLEVSRAIRERQLSPVELTLSLLERIDRVNAKLGAYYTVFAEESLEAARAAEAEIGRGAWRGPLHGVPLAFKDLYELGPTTGGSPLLAGHIATTEAELVRRVREAGAIVVGKLATHEFGLAAATLSDHLPPARNPWSPDRTPGGSSTGAGTALAAGLVFGAFGTDTGGSVRLPAAFSGVVGFKPTFGVLSRQGVLPVSESLDHTGPLARSVADALTLAAAVADAKLSLDALTDDVRGIRIAVPRDFWAPTCDEQVAARFREALGTLAQLGASVEEVDLGVGVVDVMAVGYLVALAEAAAYHLPVLRRHPAGYGPEFGLVLRAGLLVPGAAYVAAQRARARVRAMTEAVFAEHDLMAMPTVGVVADPLPAGPRPLGRRISMTPAPQYTWLANLTGGPAVSVPCGLSESGLPVGLQLVGPPGADAVVLRAAHAYEASSGWRDRHPPLWP